MGDIRWIVLIDKTPRGPLTESDVRTLIEQKTIRLNDLASKIEARPEGKKAEWKFLWQYAEFDRRRETEGTAGTPPENRRDKISEAKIEEKKKTLLPEELEVIHPEDLSYHSTSSPSHPEKNSFEQSDLEIQQGPTYDAFKKFNWKAFSAIPLLLVAGIIAFKFTGPASKIGSTALSLPKMELPALEAKEDPDSERAPSSSSPLSRVHPQEKKAEKLVPPKAESKRETQPEPVTVPSAASSNQDTGEISYEEYRRRQDEELDKENSSDNDRLASEDDEEEEEVRKKPKKKLSSKKRKAAAAAEDEEAQDPLEETIDEEVRAE